MPAVGRASLLWHSLVPRRHMWLLIAWLFVDAGGAALAVSRVLPIVRARGFTFAALAIARVISSALERRERHVAVVETAAGRRAAAPAALILSAAIATVDASIQRWPSATVRWTLVACLWVWALVWSRWLRRAR